MKREKSPIIDTIKKICPSVVNIIMSADLPKIKAEPFCPFGPFGPCWPVPEEDGSTERVKIGGGSGFIVSADGLILTNRHVVPEPKADYTVRINDEKEYPAEILARDPVNDIAILKIKAKNLPFLELGDSSQLELGQTVIAVGNVLGQFTNTVSTGIVSGLSRYITAASGLSGQVAQLRGLIQTDAAINPGNSGGPLVDIFGRVIGINTAVVLGAQNLGFAIPINSAKKDLDDYKKYGEIRQPFLGVRYIIINEDLKKAYKLPVDYGALIIKEPILGDKAVVPGSPADKAQLMEKDIILEFNKKKITEKDSLQDMIQKCKIGEEVELKVLRDEKIWEVKVKLAERKG